MAEEAKRHLRRRWIVLAIVLLLIAAVVLPPLVNLNRYRREIATSIGQSIGRQVSMSSVSLQLLPLPALTLSNFVVEEQPGFGAEPMLRAQQVTTYPRISSLWRGRLEIARIDFDHASLNLVREPDGAWNFASALVRAAETPQAPTGQRRPGKLLRFPYIEASHSRINFKSGAVKKPFSFIDSSLSVWLKNSGEWGVDFRARPVRTDVELEAADTGTLRIDGALRRGAMLSQMPLHLNVAWSNAPLGQLSRILLGRDVGWRGSFDLRARIRGPAGQAHLEATLAVARLHRSEFMPDEPLSLKTRCEATYRKSNAAIDGLSCTSLVGPGSLHLAGSISRIGSHPRFNLSLALKSIPASAILQAIKEVRGDVNAGVRAEGDLGGRITYQSESTPKLAGNLAMKSLTIQAPGSPHPFQLAPVHFLCESGRALPRSAAKSGSPVQHPALLLEPAEIPMGAKAPLAVDGRFTPSGFDLHLSGGGSLARLRGLKAILAWSGISSARTSRAALGPRGTAVLDVNLHGPWILPFTAPGEPAIPFTATGSVNIKNAELAASYLPEPLMILSAQGLLGDKTITWTDASVSYDGIRAKGTLEYPAVCAPDQPCAAHFHLAAKTVDLAEVQAALRGAPRGGDLLRDILSRIDGHPRVWPMLAGSFAVNTLNAGTLQAHNVTGALRTSGDSLKIQSLNGRFLGGAVHLAGEMKISGGQPEYTLAAEVEGASSTALARLFQEKWGGGVLDLAAQWKMSGSSARQLAGSAAGKLHWNWIRGSGAEPAAPHGHSFQFHDWSGDAIFKNRGFEIVHSRLQRGGKTIPLAGTISFDRSLDLASPSGAHPLTITGTLERPRLTRHSAAHPAL